MTEFGRNRILIAAKDVKLLGYLQAQQGRDFSSYLEGSEYVCPISITREMLSELAGFKSAPLLVSGFSHTPSLVQRISPCE